MGIQKINKHICLLIVLTASTFLLQSVVFADEKPEIFAQLGHSGGVVSVAFSPDGRYLVSGSGDNTIKLWEASTGRELRTLAGHTSTVNAVAFSPDGRYIVSGSQDDTVRLWEATTGREIRMLSHTYLVTSVAFSPDGRYIVSGSQAGTVRLWEATTGRKIKTFDSSRSVTSVVFSPDGKCIVSGGFRTLKLWEVSTGREIRTLVGHSDTVNSVAFSPDGRYLASGSRDKTLKLWEVSTGREIRTLVGHSDWVNSVAFSPDGRYLVSGSGDNTVRLWDASTGREIQTFDSSRSVTSVVFSPDGKCIVSGGFRTVKLWDVSTGKEIRTLASHTDRVRSVAFSPDGRYVVSSDGKVRFWDIFSGQVTRDIKEEGGFIDFATFSPDGRYLAAKSGMAIILWDVSTGREIRIRTLAGHTDLVSSVAFSPDGRYIVSGSGDKTVRLWEASTGREIQTFDSSRSVNSVAFSPDGRYIVSGSWGDTVKLWETSTGRKIRSFNSYDVTSAAFSPDGRYIVVSGNGIVSLWETSTGMEIRTLAGHTGFVNSVAFSPDGRYIASRSNDNTVRLWATSTGRKIRTLVGHSDWVTSAAFSPNGRYIVSGSDDGTTRLWDIATGKEIAQFISFTDGEWIAITPEGYFNASPNGAKHLNVRIGNNVYSIDNFYEKFFNPVYVASVLQGKKVEAVADIRKGFAMPPDVKIISPEPNATFNADIITITVSAKDTGGGIDEIRLYHNGKAIGEDQRAVKIVPKGNEITKTYTVTLVDGLNNFRAVGFSRDRTESNPYELLVKLTAPSKDVSLYVFAAGINKYKNPALNLNYAEPDARGIVDFFKQKGKGLFKNVALIEIYNEQATKQGITSKLKQLQNTQPQDAVLIYLAGHGESLGDKWYFIPHEITYPEREEEVKAKGISSDELSGYIKDIKAQKILMLIDACKSGAVMIAFRGFEDRKALSQLSRSTGVHIIAASTKDQFAAEVKELGHGVFTYTLLEGLKGKALGRGETVTVRKLMGYVEEQLPDITKKYKQEAQYPVVDSRGMDFPLVIVK